MQKTKILLGLVVLTALILGACSANQPVNNTMDNAMDNTMEEPMDNSSNDMMDEGNDDMSNSPHDTMEDTSDDMMEENDGESADAMSEDGYMPLWYTYQFEDAATGETFAISDFEGKVVLVETMVRSSSSDG